MALVADAAPGHAAGDGANAIAVGTVTAGQVAVETGAEPQGSGILVEVTLSVDDTGAQPGPGEIAVGHVFTVTQATPTGGFAGTLTFTTQSTQQGFTITPTGAVTANALYLFSWTG